MSNKTLINKRIGVFGKGGSGKSTVTILLSKALIEAEYHVCLLDADSTNIGLAQALGFENHPVPLMEHFGGMIFSGGLVTCPVDDPIPLTGAEISLDSLPRKYYMQDGDLTFLVAGKIGDQGPGAGCDGPVAKIARDLRLPDSGLPIVTLIDFKAGFEDTARGVITGLDWALVVVDPTSAAIEMAVNMRDMVNQIKADVLPATAHLENPELVAWANRLFVEATIQDVLVILNRVPKSEIEQFMRMKLASRDIVPIGVIHEQASISMAWLKGEQVESRKAYQEAREIVLKLEKIGKETQARVE